MCDTYSPYTRETPSSPPSGPHCFFSVGRTIAPIRGKRVKRVYSTSCLNKFVSSKKLLFVDIYTFELNPTDRGWRKKTFLNNSVLLFHWRIVIVTERGEKTRGVGWIRERNESWGPPSSRSKCREGTNDDVKEWRDGRTRVSKGTSDITKWV